MRKLLSADFFRLGKDTIFRIVLAALSVLSVVFCLMNYHTSIRFPGDPVYVEDVLFDMIPALAFVCAAVISMFLGQEYEENTIRNKLIIGHTRVSIFFSAYFTCMAASIALLFAILICSGVTGFFCFRAFLLDWTQLAHLSLCCVLLTMVFSAICVGFGMNIQKRAISMVISLLTMLVLLFAASYLQGTLQEPEMVYDGVTISMDGVEFGDLVKNPLYVEGNIRAAMEFLFDLLPEGQCIQMNDLHLERCSRWPWMSAVMLFITTALGYLPFRKRDIR